MNSKTKIFMASLVLIFGAILLTGAGCVKKPAVQPKTEAPAGGAPAGGAPAAEQPAPTKEGATGEMTDDIWVELTAQNNYHLGKADISWMGEGGGWEQLLKSKGVTEEQYTNYTSKTAAGTAALMQKVSERVKELSK